MLKVLLSVFVALPVHRALVLLRRHLALVSQEVPPHFPVVELQLVFELKFRGVPGAEFRPILASEIVVKNSFLRTP